MYKVLFACMVALFCVSAQAQRDYQSQREARAQRNFEVCVHDRTRGERRVSRREMRSVQEQCRRRVARQEQRRVERLRPRH
jgi:hypothetical protein